MDGPWCLHGKSMVGPWWVDDAPMTLCLRDSMVGQGHGESMALVREIFTVSLLGRSSMLLWWRENEQQIIHIASRMNLVFFATAQ